jgi:aminoglycoside phosphotransferase (APT) family kinase protein
MSVGSKPAAEVAIDAGLVRALLAEQQPDLADRPLVEVACGWDNAIYRLGEDLAVRLPRRQLGAELVAHEQRWLPTLAPRLPLPVPVPLRIGQPAGRYPWRWSICPWLSGEPAISVRPTDPVAAATTLGRFLAALHTPASAGAPANPYRGVPLAEREEAIRRRVRAVGGLIDGPSVLALWAELVATPVYGGPPRWLHGDLHPANILVDAGRVSAVIDFGDLTAGDPATDLAVAWMLLPPVARPVLQAESGADDDTWARARAWAMSLALAFLERSADDPALHALGRRTLAAALADHRS